MANKIKLTAPTSIEAAKIREYLFKLVRQVENALNASLADLRANEEELARLRDSLAELSEKLAEIEERISTLEENA